LKTCAFLSLLVACGSTTASSSDAGFDAPIEAAADAAPADAAPEAPFDAGLVTSLYGAFHAGIGGEHNLTIGADGTWSQTNWLCGGGGAGGTCGGGVWQADGPGLKLLPKTGDAQLAWFSGSYAQVLVAIVGGKLHAVAPDASSMDFFPGYECYVNCDSSDEVGPCAKPGHTC
jgi:hypothetical protein